jgi:TetR/AcrR family transcriptional repressor of nem operon
VPKPSHRETILKEGLRVVHQRGFANAGVREIVRAAGVPQGSFTNHFPSKEAFGLAVIDLYFAGSRRVIQDTLLNDALPPLQRLRQWLEANRANLGEEGMRNGCLFGNFTAEACAGSEAIRQKLVAVFAEIQAGVAYCLNAAVRQGEVRPDLDADEIAAFIVTSMQGATLLSKAQRSAAPVDRLERILFTAILR